MTLPLDSARRRAPDERPQQILDAALAVFDEEGLDRARLDDIARRAGIAKGTIYLYFPNKEALFREVVRQTIGSRLEAARGRLAATPDLSAEDQLCEYMRDWWDFLRTPATVAVYRLIIGELHRFPELATFYVEEVVKPARTFVAGIIDRGIERGEFRPVDVAVTGRILASLFVAQALWTCKPAIAQSIDPATPAQIFEQLCDFVLHALRPAAGAGVSNT
jgi:AcrR family transcriptional regulator